MTELKYKYILFDLDGTISKSAEGIRWSLENALNELMIPLPNLDDYSLYVGPPLIDTFRNLCGCDEQTAIRGVDTYRKYYNSKGKLMTTLYEGFSELLTKLKECDCKTAVCTSKFEGSAKEIVDLLGIAEYFDAVCGSALDESRKDKKDLIPYAIETLGGSIEADIDMVAMIGDTVFDARGAELCGVDFYGVAYGYGSVIEMKSCSAKGIASQPLELFTFLKR